MMIIQFILLILFTLLHPAVSNRVSYTIEENSSLVIAGSSNVNKFECSNYESFSDGYIYIRTEDHKDHVHFNNAILKINVKSFDCQNPLLNKDFYKALNASESPTINVELLSAIPLAKGKILKSKSGKFLADVLISLNGVSRKDELIVRWEKINANKFRFIGEADLRMSDFNIEQPVAALGFIKVRDEISIRFDLHVNINTRMI